MICQLPMTADTRMRIWTESVMESGAAVEADTTAMGGGLTRLALLKRSFRKCRSFICSSLRGANSACPPSEGQASYWPS